MSAEPDTMSDSDQLSREHGPEQAVAPLPVLERVAAVAAEHPSLPAVAGHAGQLSYGELTAQAAAFADRLRAGGVVPGDRVVVVHSPSPAMVVAVLGVLAAGAAYVPVDPGQPASRVAAVIADCQAAALVTDRPGEHGAIGVPVVRTDGDLTPSAPEGWTSDPDAPAYLIYTSGSTGEPKGVIIGHRQLAFSTAARRAVYPGADPFLLVSPLAFDSSVAGLWGTLTAGGTLVLADDDERRDPTALAALIAKFGVRATLMIPSLYRLVLGTGAGALSGLRVVVVAGEALDDGLVGEHFAALPATELVNEYGPTEVTVWATFRRYREPAPATIGAPVPGVSVQVLDAQRRPVLPGEEGELYVGGPGVAAGYHGRREATAAAFGPDPTGSSGGRWYRTGDLVRWNDRNELEFRGRTDRQVKVRGRRVQLEAIEAALQGLPGVAQAAVSTDDDHTMLVAHVRLDAAGQLAAVREAAAALPAELRPDRLHEHVNLPLNANGKIDLAALARASAAAQTPAEPVCANGSPQQPQQLAAQVGAAWEEVLRTAPVRNDVNFFDLGGNSLLVMKLQAALQHHTGKHASLVSLFRHTTVAAQAEFLARSEPPADGTDPAARRTRVAGARRSRLDTGRS